MFVSVRVKNGSVTRSRLFNREHSSHFVSFVAATAACNERHPCEPIIIACSVYNIIINNLEIALTGAYIVLLLPHRIIK